MFRKSKTRSLIGWGVNNFIANVTLYAIVCGKYRIIELLLKYIRNNFFISYLVMHVQYTVMSQDENRGYRWELEEKELDRGHCSPWIPWTLAMFSLIQDIPTRFIKHCYNTLQNQSQKVTKFSVIILCRIFPTRFTKYQWNIMFFIAIS